LGVFPKVSKVFNDRESCGVCGKVVRMVHSLKRVVAVDQAADDIGLYVKLCENPMRCVNRKSSKLPQLADQGKPGYGFPTKTKNPLNSDGL